jgi:hypothetical protein
MAAFGLGKTVLLCEGTMGGEIWKQNTVSLHFVAHGLETIKPHEKLEVGTPVGTLWSTLTAGKPIGDESFGRISFGRMTGLVI